MIRPRPAAVAASMVLLFAWARPSAAEPASRPATRPVELAMVAGRVLDADGKPVPGARIILQTWAPPGVGLPYRQPPVTTDEAGRFAVEGVTLGERGIQVRLDNRAMYGQSIRVVAGPAAPLELRLPAVGTLACVLTDGSGRPVPRPIFTVRPIGAPPPGRLALLAVGGPPVGGPDGRLDVGQVPAGRYTVHTNHTLDDDPTALADQVDVEVTVEAGRPAEARLSLRKRGGVSVVAVDDRAAPVAAVLIALVDRRSLEGPYAVVPRYPGRGRGTNPEGRCALANVPPGRYRVFAWEMRKPDAAPLGQADVTVEADGVAEVRLTVVRPPAAAR